LKTSQKLNCRKRTVRLLHGSVFGQCDWETIFCGRYKSIVNHWDVIVLQS